MFSKPVTELIKLRTSWRKYTGEPINRDAQIRINEFIRNMNAGFFSNGIRFKLVAASSNDTDELKGLGTYGFISGAPGFIIGAVNMEKSSLEDFGFLLEKIILYITDLGFGSCWLGGSFYKDSFSKRIGTMENEVVPAVIAVGYITEKRGMVDHIIRKVARSKIRKEWDELFFNDEFGLPLGRKTSGKYTLPLEMLRLSPSASNKQPWRVIFNQDQGCFHFFMQRTKGYRKPSLFSDLQRVDMGIGMCHFELTCREMNLSGRWILQKPDIQLPENTYYTVSWQVSAD